MSDLGSTLLVFTLGASRESARRKLLPADLRPLEVGLRQGCLDAVLDAGRACGCRLEVCSPSPLAVPEDAHNVPQEGAGFGERLARAAAGAFGRGAASLVIVGTDVPGLTAQPIGQALALLAADPDRVVLGPSPDGGLYLLAAGRPIAGLEAVRWCRRDTLRDLLCLLRSAGRPVTLLAPLADLDRPADLDRWLARRNDLLPGLRPLRQALSTRRRPQTPARLGRPRPALSSAPSGRSPPPALV